MTSSHPLRNLKLLYETINANFKTMTKNLSKTRIHLLSEIRLQINLVYNIYIWICPDT